jgi:CDP-paratose 2-epimerase
MTRTDIASDAVRRGLTIRLPPGADGATDQLLTDAASIGVRDLRLVIPQALWNAAGGRAGYRSLATRAATTARVSAVLSRERGRGPVWCDGIESYRAFLLEVSEELGGCCEWIELADPLGPPVWPDLTAVGAAALSELAPLVGAQVCLGGLPLSTAWLEQAAETGHFRAVRALAFHHAGQSTEWEGNLQAARALRGLRDLELWLTPDDAGVRRSGELTGPLGRAAALLHSAADRVYLGSIEPEQDTPEPNAVSTPLRSADGKPTLLTRLLGGGMGDPSRLDALVGVAVAAAAGGPTDAQVDLVIGGAGFIGSNLSARLAGDGHMVTVLDDLSRPGTEQNAAWLCERFPDRIRLLLGDVRDAALVAHAMRRARRVFHFAAQTAVTISLDHPHMDHAVNALGTLNVLEAARRQPHPPALIFTSTNKVYGDLPDVHLQQTPSGYQPLDAALRANGIDESRPVSFRSPYGCSKGAADQYVLDYAHTFGLPTVVLRMSCIYGPRQFGNEDQGWVAHFVQQLLLERPITLFGDGYQVRDVLFVDDLVEAMLTVSTSPQALSGQAFNVGGGTGNAVSLRGLIQRLGAQHGSMPDVRIEDWRPGDQRYYVSDTRRLQDVTGWQPRTGVDEGLGQLYAWMRERLGVSVGVHYQDEGRLAS